MRVRDLPIGGPADVLRWRKRRYGCDGCGRTFTETHPELPARQRVTARFRAPAARALRGGAAHAEVAREERTTRYQVARAFARRRATSSRPSRRRRRRGGCRSMRPITAAAASWRPSSPTSTAAAWSRCSTGAAGASSSASCARCPPSSAPAIEVVSIDPYDAYRQAIRSRAAATRGSSATTSTWSAAPTPRWTRSAASASASTAAGAPRARAAAAGTAGWRPELYRARHRLLKARERLTERERRRLCELFAREPVIAEAWGLKEAFRAIYRASDRDEAERRLDAFLAAVDRAALPAFDAFAEGVRQLAQELLAYFDEPTTNGYAEGVINKVKVIKRRAYGLPTFDRLPQARAPSMRLTGPRDATPLDRQEPKIDPPVGCGVRERSEARRAERSERLRRAGRRRAHVRAAASTPEYNGMPQGYFSAPAKRLRAEHRQATSRTAISTDSFVPSDGRAVPPIEQPDAGNGDPCSGRSPTCRPSPPASRPARLSPG